MVSLDAWNRTFSPTLPPFSVKPVRKSTQSCSSTQTASSPSCTAFHSLPVVVFPPTTCSTFAPVSTCTDAIGRIVIRARLPFLLALVSPRRMRRLNSLPAKKSLLYSVTYALACEIASCATWVAGGLFVALSASISVRPYKKYGVSSPGLVNLCDVARPAVPIPVGLGSVPSFWLSLMCCLRYSAPPANQ